MVAHIDQQVCRCGSTSMWRTIIDLRTIIELGQLPADVRLCHAELQLEQLLVDVLARNVEVPHHVLQAVHAG